MYQTLLNKYAVNQLAYVVDDLEQASIDHANLFGSGPFLWLDPMEQEAEFRGETQTMNIHLAYGHFGDVQIELIQSLGDETNIYTESGRLGFHHVSIWVDDVEAALEDFADAGFKPAMFMLASGVLPVYYIDCTEKWGHYVEIHIRNTSMWDFVKKSHEEWDGTNPYREMIR